MSRNNSERENILNLYITLCNKQALEDIVSEEINAIQLEKYYQGSKIDVYAETEQGKFLFVENQIKPTDKAHFESIQKLILKAPDNSIVIWGAVAFSNNFLEMVAELVSSIDYKRVEFFAVEINPNLVEILDELNQLHILKVMDNLTRLQGLETYTTTFDKYVSSCQNNTQINEYEGYVRKTVRERTNECIVRELRSKIKYPHVFRERRTMDINKLRFGAGRAGIDFELYFADRNQNAFVSCQFTNETVDIFKLISANKSILEGKIDKQVILDEKNMRLYTPIEQFEHKFDKIDQLVDLMDKYIFYLSNYFSLCSRYYVRSGNISYKGTLDDLYSNRSLTASISLPSGVSSLIKNMPPFSKMNEEQIIHHHTLYLFNTAFLYVQAKTIYTEMCSNDGKAVYVRSGLNASVVPQNEFLRYCKDCMQEDRELYGELYWHRNHQISGIHCCLKHYTPLYDSNIKVVGSNKHRFAIPTLENCSAKKSVLDGVAEKTRLEYMMHCKKLKKSILQILEQPYVHHPLEWFDQKYRNKLANMGLAYYTGRVKQKDWRKYFQTIYSEEVLHLFHSPLRGNQDWLSQIVQKNRKSFHPVRHLLVMLALELTIEEIFKKSLPQPFGQPNYPCQNIVCEYYNVPIIENVFITLCEKTKIPIGTFTCPKCEFSYTRRGPDQNEADKFRRTRVKSYGSLWERKLQEFSKSGIGLRELSRRMGADPNTIKRVLNSEEEGGLEIGKTEEFVKEDRQSWLALQNRYSHKSTKQLRELEKALYMRLYRNDREWMEENSPKSPRRSLAERVDWYKRDEEVLEKVIEVIENLLKQEEKPVRVTISKVGYLIGERSLLEKKMNKLQKTKSYLKEKVETIAQFQERRILYTINQFRNSGEDLIPWKIMRIAGIKDCDKWLNFINKKIENR